MSLNSRVCVFCRPLSVLPPECECSNLFLQNRFGGFLWGDSENVECHLTCSFFHLPLYTTAILRSKLRIVVFAKTMPYTSRLVQIRNGEYLADCESDYEDADQSSKTGRASKPSSSTISVPVFDPEGNDVSSPSQFEMSAFRLPTFTFLRNELSIPERYQRLSIDGDSGLKSLAGPRNARTSEGPPIRRPTLVKRSSIFNKSLPPLPSRRSSMRSSTHMPRRSRRLVYSKISAPNHIANVPRMSEGDEYPPDGGTMAWLHVLAGHLVIFNAQ